MAYTPVTGQASQVQQLQELRNTLSTTTQQAAKAKQGMIGQSAIQTAVQAGQAGIPTPQASQQIATQAAQKTGNLQLETQKIEQQNAQKIEQMKTQEHINRQVQDLFQNKLMAQRQETEAEREHAVKLRRIGRDMDTRMLNLNLDMQRDLHDIGTDLNDKLFNNRRTFVQKEGRRKFDNVRQIADATMKMAKSNQEANKRLQTIQRMAAIDAQIKKAAHEKLMQAETRKSTRELVEIERATQINLAELTNEAKKSAANAERNQKIIGSITSGVLMAGGALLTATGVAAPVGIGVMTVGAGFGAAGAAGAF